MSLPVLHSFAGFGLSKVLPAAKNEADKWALIIFCMIMANLPDLDFIPGVLAGDAASFHRGPSHSFAGALIGGAAAGFLFACWRKLPKLQTAAVSVFCYLSHILLDLTGKSPKGLQIFWPFTSHRFHGPFTDFSIDLSQSPLDQAAGLGSFLEAVFSGPCLHTMLIELSIVFACWFFASILKAREGRAAVPAEFILMRGLTAVICFASAVQIG